MALYRIHRTLSRATTNKPSIQAGTISPLSDMPQDKIVVLLERGLISRVQSPPLEALPQFQPYADKLQKRGIETLEQFIETESRDLARWLSVKQGDVDRLKKAMLAALFPPNMPSRG